jgi:hypothetical protein
VAAVSIPLSVLTALVVMQITGITINVMTLGGLAVAGRRRRDRVPRTSTARAAGRGPRRRPRRPAEVAGDHGHDHDRRVFPAARDRRGPRLLFFLPFALTVIRVSCVARRRADGRPVWPTSHRSEGTWTRTGSPQLLIRRTRRPDLRAAQALDRGRLRAALPSTHAGRLEVSKEAEAVLTGQAEVIKARAPSRSRGEAGFQGAAAHGPGGNSANICRLRTTTSEESPVLPTWRLRSLGRRG